MSTEPGSAETAFRVADRLARLEGPWDVYAERSRRYEVHLNGLKVELVRGPILLEGYGIRLLRRRGEILGVGSQASTDLSDEGIQRVVSEAEKIARFSSFPAPKAELPAPSGTASSVDILDPALGRDTPRVLEAYVAALRDAFERTPDAVPTFGSVKVTLVETTLANSAGLSAQYPHSMVEEEVAVKAFGGPEGRPPGEYWYSSVERRLAPEALGGQVENWVRYARDARRAKSPPSGNGRVILPPEVLDGILPVVIGFKLTGLARLRHLAPEPGTVTGPARLSISDDGRLPWATGSSPVDDEGTPQGSRSLIADGKVADILYDSLYASALGAQSTGSARRGSRFFRAPGRRFMGHTAPGTSTTVVPAGDGGSDEELIETVGDGLWIQQLGWASPEEVSTAFGGEIRIGYRIRGGKLAEPVRGGTIGGLLIAPEGKPSMFNDLEAGGSRAVLCGGIYAPALLVRSMTVSGDDSTAATAAP
jgi:predicted Zn-dependent protease